MIQNKITIRHLDIVDDKRGWVTEPLSIMELQSGTVRNMHIVTLYKDIIRGNHIHYKRTETIVTLGEAADLYYLIDGELKKLIVNKGEIVAITIPPNIPHAIVNSHNSILYCLCYSDLEYDSENPDTEPYVIV